MEAQWGLVAVWMVLALLAGFLSIRFNLRVALVEILVGIVAGNVALLLEHHQVFGYRWGMESTEGILFLAGFGSILLTFMAGAEIEPAVLRKFFKESMTIGVASFVGALVDEMRRGTERHFRRLGEAAMEYARSRGVALRSVVLRGYAADSLVRYAESEGMNLVVLGQHGYSRIARLFPGGTTDRVSEHAPCTVMIVK